MSQYVQIYGLRSFLVAIYSGLPQDSYLEHLLFLIYISDIALEISLHFRLFADDCIVFSDIKCVKPGCLKHLVSYLLSSNGERGDRWMTLI